MSFIDIEVLSHCYNPNPRTKLTLVGVGNGAHTTAAIVNGKIRVTPASGWSGVDQIPYTISDGTKRSSSKVVLTVTSTGTSKYRSGLPWASGVGVPANGLNAADVTAALQQIRAWETFRGRKVDIYNSKSNNATWDSLLASITAKAGLYQALYDEGIAIEQVIDYIADSPGVSGLPLAACASGAFDAQHRKIASVLNGFKRRAPFVLRLGHELNMVRSFSPQNDPGASRGDYSMYKAAFRRTSLIYKSTITNPPVLIDWNWLRKPKDVSPAAAYPGDDCVDIIGLDSYNNDEKIVTDADFTSYASAKTSAGWPSGPQSWIDFAVARGKKCGVAEWAVTNPDGKGSVYDSAAYIRGMYNLFMRNANNFVYECYFDMVDQKKDHTLGSASTNPNATAEYQRQWMPR
jgi:hypothetical protein